jgi:hypothetical protein
VAFEVSRQAPVATDPGERSFDDPAFWQHLKACCIGSFDNLQLPSACAPDDHSHFYSRVSAISKDALDKWEQPPRPVQQVEGTVAVLNISGMNDDVQQQAQRVDQDVPLATFDLLARVVARRIERRPPF